MTDGPFQEVVAHLTLSLHDSASADPGSRCTYAVAGAAFLDPSHEKVPLNWHYTGSGHFIFVEAAPRIELGYTALQAVLTVAKAQVRRAVFGRRTPRGSTAGAGERFRAVAAGIETVCRLSGSVGESVTRRGRRTPQSAPDGDLSAMGCVEAVDHSRYPAAPPLYRSGGVVGSGFWPGVIGRAVLGNS